MKQIELIFEQKFPKLYILFAGYFADSATDDIPDEDVAIDYKNLCLTSEKGKHSIDLIFVELEQLMLNIDEFWEAVVDSSNRYFENPEDTKTWLKMIKETLSK